MNIIYVLHAQESAYSKIRETFEDILRGSGKRNAIVEALPRRLGTYV